jgi:SOS-response transcriptional repressor LexA
MSNHDKKDATKDTARAEWEADQLIALMGHHLARRRGGSPFDDPRFLEWLSRELRRRPHSPQDWSADTVRAMRHRVLSRAAALRLSVVAREGEWVERRPWIRIHAADAVAEAAREGCMPLMEPSVAAGEGRELWDGECERWIERPPELPPGQYLALPVSGDSMTPLMHAGDVVAVRLGAAVRRDTVVVARQADDGYVVKRVGTVRSDVVELTSLNPNYRPIWIRREKNAVLGTVVLRWCAHNARPRDREGGEAR